MPRGRPVGSQIRQNIIDVLYYQKDAYGYEIYKVYREVFPKVTMRSIYYHLNKGVELGEFKVHKVEDVKGDYSWGDTAQKVYYSLSKNAKPTMSRMVKDYLDKKKKKKK